MITKQQQPTVWHTHTRSHGALCVCVTRKHIVCACKKPQTKPLPRRFIWCCSFSVALMEHGFHNVSRWMTWLPISLKNAAKCDKWYQLQNHSITESLNANGAREKPFTGQPRACRISVSNNKPMQQRIWFRSLASKEMKTILALNERRCASRAFL